MRRNVSAAALLFAAIAVTACASTSTPTTRGSPDRVTAAEIDATTASTAHDLVFRLRPQWLRTPATASISGGRVASQVILVYYDNQRLGEVDFLRSVSASSVRSMRYLDATRAPALLPDIRSNEPIAGAILLSSTP